MGCHFLLQGIFPTQGSNPGLQHCRQILNHLSHQGNHIYYILYYIIYNIHYINISWYIHILTYIYTCPQFLKFSLPSGTAGFQSCHASCHSTPIQFLFRHTLNINHCSFELFLQETTYHHVNIWDQWMKCINRDQPPNSHKQSQIYLNATTIISSIGSEKSWLVKNIIYDSKTY